MYFGYICNAVRALTASFQQWADNHSHREIMAAAQKF
jgi:hypothetical protein